MFIKVVLTGCLFYIIYGEPMDYKALLNNIRIEYYNTDLAAPNSSFSFFKYNRTQFALNASLWILKDIDGRQIKSVTKLYLFLSNSFVPSGFQIEVPSVCKMWEDNLYGIRTIMRKCGDVDLCNIKKGYWHIGNCSPAESIKYWPKSVPQGSYKITMESSMYDGTPLVVLAWYGETSLYFKEMKKSQTDLIRH